jgi:hypothetical protein
MNDAPSRRLAPRLLAAGMAIPFAWAVLVHLAGPTPAPMAVPPERGALVFEQYLVDLGPVHATSDVVGYFDFRNRGQRPIEIQALEPSCGCLQPRLEKLERRRIKSIDESLAENAAAPESRRVEKRVYEPGEGGFFSVRVQTANQSPGQKEYTVKVKYKDLEPHETVVTFRVILPDEQVLVRPIALMFYQLSDEAMETKPQKFEVTDRRARHLKITKVECSRPDIKIEEETSEIDDDGVWHGRFQVKVPNQLPPGQAETIVRIYTDDPAEQYHVLRIPLYLVGPHSQGGGNGVIEQTGGTAPQKTGKTGLKPRKKLQLER